MGKFEKLVVLLVFLAAAVVLAVALNRGKAELEAASPLRGAQEVLGNARPTTEKKSAPAPRSATHTPEVSRPASEPVGPDSGTSLLLNAGAEKPAPTGSTRLSAEPVSDREHRILESSAGLRPGAVRRYVGAWDVRMWG
jgi:hypothetical protein